MIFGFKNPTYNEIRFAMTTGELKKYAKRIGCKLNTEDDKLTIIKKILLARKGDGK